MSEIWMCRVPLLAMAAGCRWWLTDYWCHCSAACNWQSTPRWVCALHGDGRPRRGAAEMDGVAILAASRAKERRFPEFVGVQARGSTGRPCCESWEAGSRRRRTGSLQGWPRLVHGAKHPRMQRRVEQAWRMRWSLVCSGARRRKLWLHLFWRCKDVSRFSWTVFHFIRPKKKES